MSENHLICIVDDDPSVRDSLCLLLGLKGFDCRAYESAELFLQAKPLKPCCIVLDLKMSGMDGLELQQRLVHLDYPSQIVFLTAHADVAVMRKAFLNKAVDFLEKPFSTDKLLESIERAFHNLSTVSQDQEIKNHLENLTPREREVLAHLSNGNSHRQIGEALGISPRTVEVHKARIMQKLGTKTLAELLRLVVSRHTST